MPVTREQVERFLNVDEPDYAAAARLGFGALQHLEAMAREAGPGLAVKAVYLASLIGNGTSAIVIDAASRRTDPVLRVAAAAAIGRVSADRLTDIATRLVSDSDPAVRQRALAALPTRSNPGLSQRLSDLADFLPAGERKNCVLDALHKVRQ